MERKFIFKNFVPSLPAQEYCSRKFHQVWGQSPSGSNVSANVVREVDSSYRTVIEITAACGKFRAEATDKAVLASIKKATDKLGDLMKSWRSKRFLNEIA